VTTDRPKQPRKYPPQHRQPSRAEAERDPKKFIELLEYLKERGKLPLTLIASALDIDKGTASRRMKSLNFDKDEMYSILQEMDSKKILFGKMLEQIHDIKHNLFYSMMDYFNIDEDKQDECRANLVGTYRLWRYSTEFDGEFVFGKLTIEEDKTNGDDDDNLDATALGVTIRQVRKKRSSSRETDEVLKGYIFRIHERYVMLVKQADEITHNFRCTIFKEGRNERIGRHRDKDSIFPEHTMHLVQNDGFAIGMDAGSVFFSPIYIELVDNRDELDQLDSELDLVGKADLPDRVLKKLERYKRGLI
jgi:hypothetical protein